LAKIFHYRGPFDSQLIKDLDHPVRRVFLMAAIENYVPENKQILDAIDVFYMTFQAVNLKKGHKPKSMFQEAKKENRNFFTQMVPDKETGEMRKVKVYY